MQRRWRSWRHILTAQRILANCMGSRCLDEALQMRRQDYGRLKVLGAKNMKPWAAAQAYAHLS